MLVEARLVRNHLSISRLSGRPEPSRLASATDGHAFSDTRASGHAPGEPVRLLHCTGIAAMGPLLQGSVCVALGGMRVYIEWAVCELSLSGTPHFQASCLGC